MIVAISHVVGITVPDLFYQASVCEQRIPLIYVYRPMYNSFEIHSQVRVCTFTSLFCKLFHATTPQNVSCMCLIRYTLHEEYWHETLYETGL